MLVLMFPGKTNNICSDVYRKTAEFIAAKAPNAVRYNYRGDVALLNFIQKHKFYAVVSTNEISPKTAILLKGLDLIQVLIGAKQSAIETADIIIDPLIPKSNQYLVGTKYLLPYIVEKENAQAIANFLKLDRDGLTNELSHSQAQIELLDVLSLYRRLKWDSDFFGFNVAYVSCLRLTPNIEKHIAGFVRKENIRMLEYLCNCHDKKSVITAEKNGYSFVDIRLTFEHFVQNNYPVNDCQGYCVREAGPKDIAKLRKIASNIYRFSRYYYDSNFDKDKVAEFYANWVEKAVLGKFDDFVYVLCHLEEPIGFCSIRKNRLNSVTIGLFGMHSNYSGRGLSKYLLDTSLQKLRDSGIHYVEVVTQGRNYAAQRLYQRSGFLTKSVELWYHKWF